MDTAPGKKPLRSHKTSLPSIQHPCLPSLPQTCQVLPSGCWAPGQSISPYSPSLLGAGITHGSTTSVCQSCDRLSTRSAAGFSPLETPVASGTL